MHHSKCTHKLGFVSSDSAVGGTPYHLVVQGEEPLYLCSGTTQETNKINKTSFKYETKSYA